MKFTEYVDKYGVSTGKFSELLGVTKGSTSKWYHRKSKPQPFLRKKIEEITEGKVKVEDWDEPHKEKETDNGV